ncbi:hypothetical protein [Psychroserpens ponticola]|uniref:SGNH/GDSL hydrolase family protein n=1 Tax=Psychroserpens ponticola TaxID=2932268 RepID=A0ABY7S1S4_9FLAO|nr:hypothetical protein [Psychroserpens ponticola]WCO03088.1 hypothetical protein MUN68_006245 [Psychroserpens ponticola]
MKKFIIRFIVFLIVGYAVGEIIVRSNKLTSDIPQRYVDDYGVQKYIPGQTGYYKGAKVPWTVNKFGWIGVSHLNNRPKRMSVIGDSYIENLMNSITCNQGYLLQNSNKNIDFFEAGRSGITFIEAMEITKRIDSLNFDKHLIYVSNGDFEESFSDTFRYEDRMQFDTEKNTLLPGNLKSPGLKKILYNTKFLYYLYSRFPLFVSKQNKGEVQEKATVKKEIFNAERFNKLFIYCQDNYDLDTIVLVFHPNTSDKIINFFSSKGMNTIILQEKANKTWDLSAGDGHWSCYGHEEASKQITLALKAFNF